MRPINHDLQESREFYALTDGNVIRKRWHLNKLKLSHLTAISPGHRVLDAGCGAGNLVSELAAYSQQAIGCDYRYPCLAFGARRGRGSYVQADLRQLPFPTATFEAIYCMEVLEHLDQATTTHALSEFYRVLKPRGQMLLTTPNYRSLWVVIEFLADTLRIVPDMVGGEHISKYHRRTFINLLTEAGFVTEKIGTFNHASPFIALLSERWAECIYRWELKEGRRGGNLLYAICHKP
jgi:ubiquinone/menaquinone biosynthesis C-methylase UbiE